MLMLFGLMVPLYFEYQNDYRSKISIEMLSIETTVINAADSPPPMPSANNSTFLSSGTNKSNTETSFI